MKTNRKKLTDFEKREPDVQKCCITPCREAAAVDSMKKIMSFIFGHNPL